MKVTQPDGTTKEVTRSRAAVPGGWRVTAPGGRVLTYMTRVEAQAAIDVYQLGTEPEPVF